MLLIAISPPELLPWEGEAVRQLLDAGLDHYYLRKPKLSAHKVKPYLATFNPEQLKKVILARHRDLTTEFAVGGIHGSLEELGKRPADGLLRSTSAHSFSEAGDAEELADLILFGPVFPSISKPGHSPAFEIEVLASFLRRRKKASPKAKILALGGLSEDNVAKVKEAGFDGAAVLGALWNTGSATAAVEFFGRLREKCA